MLGAASVLVVHARLWFFSDGGGFSHIGRLEERDNGENIEWTNTDHSGVKAPPHDKEQKKRKKKKTQIQTQLQGLFSRVVVVVGGGASIIIEDSQWIKQKQFSSCCDSCHPIHKRGRFYIMTSSVDIFSADKRRTKLYKQAVSLEGKYTKNNPQTAL